MVKRAQVERDGATLHTSALEAATPPMQDGDGGSVFGDPGPTVQLELQGGLFSTVVPPPCVPVTQQVQDLVGCATGEPDTVRVHMRLRAEALATKAGCERSYPLQEWDRAHPQEASACGMLQSAIVASINMLEENRHAKHIYVCRDW